MGAVLAGDKIDIFGVVRIQSGLQRRASGVGNRAYGEASDFISIIRCYGGQVLSG